MVGLVGEGWTQAGWWPVGHCVLSSGCDAVLVQAGCFDAGVGQSSSDEGPGMGEQNE